LTFLSIDIATERATIFYLNLGISSGYFNDSQRDTQWNNMQRSIYTFLIVVLCQYYVMRFKNRCLDAYVW